MKILVTILILLAAFTEPEIPAEEKVYGVFVGRTPCEELATAWNVDVPSSCFKLKWEMTLNVDPGSGASTTYKIDCTLSRAKAWTGKWSVVQGTKENPKATVFVLDPDKSGQSKFFMKGDENVLFFLDDKKSLLKGNKDFSYTLNRAVE